MKKRKLSFFVLLLSGLFSAAVCFFLFKAYFHAGWRFDIMKVSHWQYLADKWNSGWVMSTPKEMMFFAGFVAIIPVWLTTWVLCYIMPWKGILLFPLTLLKKRKAEKLLQKSIEAAKGPENIQAALAAKKAAPKETAHKAPKISSDKMTKIDKLRGRTSHAHSAAPQPVQTAGTFEEPVQTQHQPVSPTALPSAETPQTAAASDQKSRTLQVWDDLAALMEKSGIFIFREMKIGAYETNIIAVTNENVFLLSEGPKLGSNWTVCENDTPPVWKDGKDALASPLRPLLDARNKLKEHLDAEFPQYSSLVVNACLVLDHGNVTNTKALIEKLEEWDMSVLRTGTCKTTDLPEVGALLSYIRTQAQATQEVSDAIADTLLFLMETGSDF